ncbi:MAG: transporter, partial [Herminiimonas sp.]|nr:transporter [Herminiimonas sp.]
NRFIPESPRFLSNAGLGDQAREVLAKFSGVIDKDHAVNLNSAAQANDSQTGGFLQLMRGSHAAITWGLTVCGVAWGLVNFGFLLWLPTNLGSMGMDASAASALLARSAILALPGILLVIWLYHSWNSIKTLVCFIALTTGTLLIFFFLGAMGIRSTGAMVATTALLLVSASGVIATLIPYAAEIFPVHLRATGSGLIAASSKFGGILGAVCGVLGLFNDLAWSALCIAVPMALSAFMLIRSGIDTRGRRLEEIQDAVLKKQKAAMRSR